MAENRVVFQAFLVAFIAAGSGADAAAQTTLKSVRVASGLTEPLFVHAPPGDLDRVFIVEQDGRIKILRDGNVLPTSFLDIDALVNSTTLEWGLLGLCFHPNYAANGYFFVNYSNATGESVIARYRVSTGNPDVADPASGQIVLFLDQPDANHRGGWLDFRSDGYMYCSFGDGGPQNDPNNRAQNLGLLQGKILRLDVDGPDNIMGNADDDGFPADPNKLYAIPPTNPFVGVAGEDEIWAYGLRNPWRCAFDRANGNLYIADVGQFAREEINFQPAGGAGGANYGWRCMEGTTCTGMTGCICNAPSLTLPIHEYPHTLGRCSITGGYVYRGPAIPGLPGTYFFADWCGGQIYSLRYNGVTVTELTDRTAELIPDVGAIDSVTSFGEDGAGEIYLCDGDGEVYKIVADIIDCNVNGIPDDQDIAGGTSPDCNANAVPDECELAGDNCNVNGTLDECDLAAGTSPDCNNNDTPDECEADCNVNGRPDACDIAGGTSPDCQPDGTPDECQLVGNDCNADGTPDACQLAGNDCDANATPDDCEPDCDGNGTADACDPGVVRFQDDFETDTGWTVQSDAPVDGVWERADPRQTLFNGNIVQPEDDNPSGSGTLCYVTEASGPVTNSSDVDNGPTRLTSPTVDLSSGVARVRYAYWFHTELAVLDTMTLQVSNDNGNTWVTMNTHTVSASVWRVYSGVVDDYIPCTATMRFRFVISDPGNDSYTEGLIDDFVLTTPDCPTGCTPPPAALVSVCSNRTHANGPCCIPITGTIPAESSEPRSGGIEQLQVTFAADLCPEALELDGAAVTIQETSSALYPAFQPYSGPSAVTTSGAGANLTLSFSTPLADARAYRFTFTPSVTSLPGQSFDIRALTADVTSSGRTDAGDRSAVVGVWTGTGFTCQTDINRDGITNSGDRSAVVGIWTSPNNTAP